MLKIEIDALECAKKYGIKGKECMDYFFIYIYSLFWVDRIKNIENKTEIYRVNR